MFDFIFIGGQKVQKKVFPVDRDGACLFSSISYCVYGTVALSNEVRHDVVAYVTSHWNEYQVSTYLFTRFIQMPTTVLGVLLTLSRNFVQIDIVITVVPVRTHNLKIRFGGLNALVNFGCKNVYTYLLLGPLHIGATYYHDINGA